MDQVSKGRGLKGANVLVGSPYSVAVGTMRPTPVRVRRIGTTLRPIRTTTLGRAGAVTINRFRLGEGYGLAGRPCNDGQPFRPASANTLQGPVKRGVARERRNPRPAISHWGISLGKKYRHLIERIVSDGNMRIAYHNTATGRRFTHGALTFKEYAECNLARLSYDLHTGEYEPGEPNRFYVYEPKARLITALPFRDRVAQHAVHNIIGPIFEATFLPRTYACRRGKGTHAGVRDLQAELRLSLIHI